jgi:hypothetical protein
MRTVLLTAFAMLVFVGISDTAIAQGPPGPPGPGDKIYDAPPRHGSFPRGTRGFYLKKFGMPGCAKGMYWVRLAARANRPNYRSRTTTCVTPG